MARRPLGTFSLSGNIRSGLEKLLFLNEEDVSKLAGIVQEESPAATLDLLAGEVADKFPKEQAYDVYSIVASLTALHRTRRGLDLSNDEFAETIAKSLVLKGDKSLSEEQREMLSKRASLLINLEPVGVTSKAYEVLLQHEHVFTKGRILTDIRPVFSDQKEKSVAATVIVHTLKLEYIQDDEHREFFVALDSADVRKMHKVLSEAIEKEECLKAMLESTKFPYLEVKDEDPSS